MIEAICWLCNAPITIDAQIITVERTTPGGLPSAPKKVAVHFPCLMDMEP